MIDRYTKIVLTIIAMSLVGLFTKDLLQPASAQISGCGSGGNPCYVQFDIMAAPPCGTSRNPCHVTVN